MKHWTCPLISSSYWPHSCDRLEMFSPAQKFEHRPAWQSSKSVWSAINECFHLTVMSATLHKRAPHLHRLHQQAPGDELFTYVCFHFWLKIPLDSQMGLISSLKKKKKKLCLFLKRTVVYIMNSWLFKGDWAGHENLKFLLH